jgi:hypothetical protein
MSYVIPCPSRRADRHAHEVGVSGPGEATFKRRACHFGSDRCIAVLTNCYRHLPRCQMAWAMCSSTGVNQAHESAPLGLLKSRKLPYLRPQTHSLSLPLHRLQHDRHPRSQYPLRWKWRTYERDARAHPPGISELLRQGVRGSAAKHTIDPADNPSVRAHMRFHCATLRLKTSLCRNPFPGQAPPEPVQRTLDIEIPRKYTNLSAPKVKLAVFWPPGERPDGGRLPCYLHIRASLS